MSGMALVTRCTFHDFEVTFVADGTPAAEAGVRKGDYISMFGDRRAMDLTLAELKELLQESGVYNLQIKRGDEEITTKITLRPLI